jgi:hypothetical protein
MHMMHASPLALHMAGANLDVDFVSGRRTRDESRLGRLMQAVQRHAAAQLGEKIGQTNEWATDYTSRFRAATSR